MYAEYKSVAGFSKSKPHKNNKNIKTEVFAPKTYTTHTRQRITVKLLYDRIFVDGFKWSLQPTMRGKFRALHLYIAKQMYVLVCV